MGGIAILVIEVMMVLTGISIVLVMIVNVFNLWIVRKVELDIIDYAQNRDLRRTLDDKLKLLFYRIGKSASNQLLMDFRNRRIVGVKYSYHIPILLIKGWRDCWDGMIYLHVETEGPLHLEIRTVVEVPPQFKEEALKLLVARKVVLGRTHEKMDPQ